MGLALCWALGYNGEPKIESLSQEVAIGCVRMTLLPHTKVKEDVSIK